MNQPPQWPPQGQPADPYSQQPYVPQPGYPPDAGQQPGWGQQGPYGGPPGFPPPGPPRRRKSRTGRNAAIAGGAVIALVIAVAAANGKHGSPQAPPSPAAAATSAAAAQPARAASVQPKPHTVAVFRGSGIRNTPRFRVTSTWKLSYSFSCSSFGQSGNFQVFPDGGNDLQGPEVNELAMRKSGSTWAYGDAGTHYLEISSECDWTVKVTDEP